MCAPLHIAYAISRYGAFAYVRVCILYACVCACVGNADIGGGDATRSFRLWWVCAINVNAISVRHRFRDLMPCSHLEHTETEYSLDIHRKISVLAGVYFLLIHKTTRCHRTIENNDIVFYAAQAG